MWFGSACESELGKKVVVKVTDKNSSKFLRYANMLLSFEGFPQVLGW